MSALWRGVLPLGLRNHIHVERCLGERICARGGQSTRRRGDGIFASTVQRQAMDYTDGDAANLRRVHPDPGAMLTWLSGTMDAMLDLEAFFSQLWWTEQWDHSGLSCEALLRDAQGDIDILDTYLSMGRQKRRIGAMIDSYLDTIEIRDCLVAHDRAWERALAGHCGEVWVSGPCRLDATALVQRAAA